MYNMDLIEVVLGVRSSSLFESDVVCPVSVVPLQHRSCSVWKSFDRLGPPQRGRLVGKQH